MSMPEGVEASERDFSRLERDDVRDLLGTGGPLASVLPGFERRESQEEMALAVAEAFRNGGELLVEAGTGTGKTFAYLVPAVLSGQRVVISTGTKNLQDQLFFKDIPLVRKALAVPFTACLMKGRGNYLCLARFAEFTQKPSFRFFEETTHFDTLTRWAQLTKTGDRNEIPGVPDRLDFWKGISARSENCVGKDCPDFERCYVTRLRQRAAESDLIVVNHHLLFADLMVREGSFGEVLPEYDHLILDEAHQIEDVATQYFGLSVSNARVEELARDVEKAWEEQTSGGRLRAAKGELRRLRGIAQALFEAYRAKDERYRLRPKATTTLQDRARRELQRQLDRVRGDLATVPKPDERTVALVRRAGEIQHDLDVVLTSDDPESVSWCEQRERSLALRCSPINVAPMIRHTLLSRKRTVVLTSATLAVDGGFDYVSERVGVSASSCRLLPSPYDYERQALLYVPRHLPPPRQGDFVAKAAEEVRALLEASRGRAFVLFTSFHNLHAVRRMMPPSFPFPVLVQGEAPKAELLERFRSSGGSVLFATSSFWEGVDVMGEQLSLVIVDKLPFAVPGDPLVSARIDWVESTGGNGFRDYQVPMAILALKQGLGRLIRSRSDRGVVAVLDSRLATMGYGGRFLTSLPPYRLVHDREEVRAFFAQETEAP